MTTATVETLTAEVRVLMVGNRQITLSVYKQLDFALPWRHRFMPFGRVHAGTRTGAGDLYDVELVGSNEGVLVRSGFIFGSDPPGYPYPHRRDWDTDRMRIYEERETEWRQLSMQLRDLPLIVLAGLR